MKLTTWVKDKYVAHQYTLVRRGILMYRMSKVYGLMGNTTREADVVAVAMGQSKRTKEAFWRQYLKDVESGMDAPTVRMEDRLEVTGELTLPATSGKM